MESFDLGITNTIGNKLRIENCLISRNANENSPISIEVHKIWQVQRSL